MVKESGGVNGERKSGQALPVGERKLGASLWLPLANAPHKGRWELPLDSAKDTNPPLWGGLGRG